METVITTVPTIWDTNNEPMQNGEPISVAAGKQKALLDKCLHEDGYEVKQHTIFTYGNVVYVHYILVRYPQ